MWLHFCKCDRSWLYVSNEETCSWCGITCEEVQGAPAVNPDGVTAVPAE